MNWEHVYLLPNPTPHGVTEVVSLEEANAAVERARVETGAHPSQDARHEAEDAYTISAFDYERDPVGSRDWTLFWKGWQAGARSTPSLPAQDAEIYLCPDGCGCTWRDNHDGTMSLAGPNSKSCKVCEWLPLKKLIPLWRGSTPSPDPPKKS